VKAGSQERRWTRTLLTAAAGASPLALPNVILTPHISEPKRAGISGRIGKLLVQNVERLCRQPLLNRSPRRNAGT